MLGSYRYDIYILTSLTCRLTCLNIEAENSSSYKTMLTLSLQFQFYVLELNAKETIEMKTFTSSHSEVKEGDFSSLFLPVLQLETDSLRFPSPPSSSLGGDTSRSESDLERLRASFRSPGGRVLMVDAAPDAEALGSLCTVA